MLELYFHVLAFSGLRVEFNFDFCMFFKWCICVLVIVIIIIIIKIIICSAVTAALLAEQRKHQANDPKCDTLGWKCIPLAVESYGNWGLEARQAFSHLASHLSFGIGHQKSKLLVDIYGRLNVTLVRCNARALLSRACNLV